MTRTGIPRKREQGFALLIVLWSVALLSFLAMHLAASGRSEVRIAANIRNAAIVEAAADDLVYATIVRLMRSTPAERGVDGIDHRVTVPGGRATLRVTSLAGRINPNVAAQAVIAALIRQAGIPPDPAANLAAAIADWRTPGTTPRPGGAKLAQYRQAGLAYTPPNTPFESIGELGLVLGMTRGLLLKLAPHMTVFYPGDPVSSAADPTVQRVLRSLDLLDPLASPEGTDLDTDYVEITVSVRSNAGAVFTRVATVEAGHGLSSGRYRILQWEQQ